jgi:hypothetical protein
MIGINNATTTLEVAPTGMTNRQNRASTAEVSIHDTNGGVASWTSTNRTNSGTGNWISYMVELLALPVQAAVELISAPMQPMSSPA